MIFIHKIIQIFVNTTYQSIRLIIHIHKGPSLTIFFNNHFLKNFDASYNMIHIYKIIICIMLRRLYS